jgi:hypothetical protein
MLTRCVARHGARQADLAGVSAGLLMMSTRGSVAWIHASHTPIAAGWISDRDSLLVSDWGTG